MRRFKRKDPAVRAGGEIGIIITSGADDTKFRIDIFLKRNADLVRAECADTLYPPDRDILPPKKLSRRPRISDIF